MSISGALEMFSMVTAVRGEPERLDLQEMRFLPRAGATQTNQPYSGPVVVPFHDIDRSVEELARSRGHTVRQIASLSFTVMLTSADTKHTQTMLPITVRRDSPARTYTAKITDPRLSWAWGHGNTIGEAFHDCLDELSQRSQFLLDHRDELGPALQPQADGLEAWTKAQE